MALDMDFLLIAQRRHTRLARTRLLIRLFVALPCMMIATFASAMSAEQYFEDGNRLYRDDLYWAALLRYQQAAEAGMDTALLHFNAGVAHYRAGQHIRAREEFTKALQSPSLSVAAHYNLGLNAYAAGNSDEALRWLRAARYQGQHEELAEYAEVAIARILSGDAGDDLPDTEPEAGREETSISNLEIDAEISFGTNDNVFRTPADAYIDFADPALPLVTPEVRSGAYMPINLGVRYKINAFDHEGFFAAYRLAGRYYQDRELENANERSHELSFGSEYSRKDAANNRERRVFSAFSIAQHDELYFDPDDGDSRIVDDVLLDDRFNYLRYGPELLMRQSWGRLAIGLDIKGQLWNYEEIDVVPAYDHEYFHVGLFGQYRFTATSLLRITASASSRRFGERRAREIDGSLDIDNPLLRYDYLDIGLLARQRITQNMWFGVGYRRLDRVDQFEGYSNYTRDTYGVQFHWDIGSRFRVALMGDYHLYNYPNTFAFHNPVAGRKTLESADANLTASYRMTRHLDLFLEADYRERVSNDTRIQYGRRQYVLGVRWAH